MPRISPYKIILSREEALELIARASKYTLPYFKVIRAKMILLVPEKGLMINDNYIFPSTTIKIPVFHCP